MKKKNIIILLFIMLCFILVFMSPVFAKYIKEQNSNINITADKFYFTVDLLGDTNDPSSLNKVYNFYGGDQKEVLFKIQNYFDDFRINQTDIKYTIDFEVELPAGSGYDSSTVSLTNTGTGTLTKASKNADICHLVVPAGYDNNTQVIIRVASTVPYSKVMTMTFVLKTFDSECSFYIVDSKDSLYAELVVKTNVIIPAGKLIIDFSDINSLSNALQVDLLNMYLLDNVDGVLKQITNKVPTGETYLKKVVNTTQINAGEAVVFKFFKEDISKNYSCTETYCNGVDSIYEVVIPNI